MPEISVIMPVFNAEGFVKAAVTSVFEQMIPNIELICIDDGSTDNSAQIIKTFGNKVKYIKTKQNAGAAAARNIGVKLATSEFITFLDADDRFAPGALSSQLRYHKQYNKGNQSVVLGKSKIVFEAGSSEVDYFLDKSNGEEFFLLVLGALLIPIEVFKSMGDFDESLALNDDVEWFMRLKDHKIMILRNEETVLHISRHGQNLTSDTTATNRAHLELFYKRIKSKR